MSNAVHNSVDAMQDDVSPLGSVEPERKYHRLKSVNPKRAQKVAKLRAIRSINVATGKLAVAKQCFECLLDRINAGVEGSCLVLYGRSGAGKTHILRQLRKHPDLQPFETDEGKHQPLLCVEAPAPCTLRSLGMRILHALQYFPRKSLREHEVWDRVRANLAAQGVAVLIIDEAHNVLKGRNAPERDKIAMTIKALMVSEENPIQVILAGLPSLSTFVDSYSELKRRAQFIELTPLQFPRDQKNLIAFLSGLESMLGFGKAGFTEFDMPERFMAASRGLIGRMAYFAQEAATIAVSLGSKLIDRAYLSEAYKRPYRASPDNNPFLMANVAAYRPPKGQVAEDADDLTFLKGTKQDDADDVDAAA